MYRPRFFAGVFVLRADFLVFDGGTPRGVVADVGDLLGVRWVFLGFFLVDDFGSWTALRCAGDLYGHIHLSEDCGEG